MITVYPAACRDFSTLGLGALQPISCTVEEEAGGAFTLEMEHPIDDDMRWTWLYPGNIIKAPCPIRESPLIEMKITKEVPNTGVGTTTITKTYDVYKVKTSTGQRLNFRQGDSMDSAIISAYKPGTEVVKESTSGDWAQVMVNGQTGYMYDDNLEYVRSYTETYTVPTSNKGYTVSVVSRNAPPRKTRDQLFRIVSTDRDSAKRIITVHANHIFYDLIGNIVNDEVDYEEDTAVTTAFPAVTEHLINDHEFTFYSGLTEGVVQGTYTGVSVVKALLDPDIGIVPQCEAQIIRDNFDILIFKQADRDRGVEIRHGKNLTGAVLTTDYSSVVTRIKPIGKGDGDKRLTLPDPGYVDSPHINDYPVIYAQELECDAKNEEELREKVQEEFGKGVDLPTVTLDVDFVALENTREYAQYADLLTLHLYDTVRVVAKHADIDAKLRVNGYKYDCLLDCYDSLTLGDLEQMESRTYGYDIAQGTITGSHIANNSVQGSVLRNATINYAKISVAAIEQLSADAIKAVRADIHEIVAGSITTDELYADLAKLAAATITTANINEANIDWAQIATLMAQVAEIADAKIANAEISSAQIADLEATVAEITDAKIRTAEITSAQITDLSAKIAEIADAKIANAEITTAQINDLTAEIIRVVKLDSTLASFTFAEIQTLLGSALVLEKGVADTMLITNLQVTNANLLSATLGKLILKGDDGKYYAVRVGSDGIVHTEEVEPTESEIEAGVTGGGTIIDSGGDVGGLDGGAVSGGSALFAEVITRAMTAKAITAGEALISSATIPALYTTSIQAIGDALDLSANASIKAMVGTKITTADAPPEAPSLGALWMDVGVDPTVLRRWIGGAADTSRDGGGWETISDTAKIEAALNSVSTTIEQHADMIEQRISRGELETYIRFDENGVEIGKSSSDYKAFVDNEGYSVRQNGGDIARFEKRTLIAPNIRVAAPGVETNTMLRHAADGGIMIV